MKAIPGRTLEEPRPQRCTGGSPRPAAARPHPAPCQPENHPYVARPQDPQRSQAGGQRYPHNDMWIYPALTTRSGAGASSMRWRIRWCFTPCPNTLRPNVTALPHAGLTAGDRHRTETHRNATSRDYLRQGNKRPALQERAGASRVSSATLPGHCNIAWRRKHPVCAPAFTLTSNMRNTPGSHILRHMAVLFNSRPRCSRSYHGSEHAKLPDMPECAADGAPDLYMFRARAQSTRLRHMIANISARGSVRRCPLFRAGTTMRCTRSRDNTR